MYYSVRLWPYRQLWWFSTSSQQADKTSCVKCVFTTPSGHGLKAIVLHDNKDPQFHRDLYEQLLNKFDVASKDLSCKDIARRNYLSYDPDIWVNNNAIPYHYIPSIKDVQDNEQTGIHIKEDSLTKV